MHAKRFLCLGICLILSGCGTLQIDIDYGWTPEFASPPATATVPTAAPSSTATPTVEPPLPTVTPTESLTGTAAPVRAVSISSGERHTCAVLNTGRVMCWGNNEHGQLGDGTMVNRSIPVEVLDIVDATVVAAGFAHTCALNGAGAVKCWGYNKNGELGDGKTVDSSVPMPVSSLSSGVVAIASKEDHACAVTSAGAVKCWGYNEYGQLGDGSRTSRSVPVAVPTVRPGIVAVAVGWGHTCALSSGGAVECWGNNEYGQLGYGEEASLRLTPVDVLGLLNGTLAIGAAGGQTCALSPGGGARCWGNNKYGQLGDGTGEPRFSPVAVDGLGQGVAAVAVGWNHTCAVMGNGELKCWGWNYYGQIGDETRVSKSRPVNVRRLMENAVAAAPGWASTCAITASGGVKCWGRNDSGQLGDGTTIDSAQPLSVVGLV
jgi:alpha-tubulin suppressor-like RCC1 family protein